MIQDSWSSSSHHACVLDWRKKEKHEERHDPSLWGNFSEDIHITSILLPLAGIWPYGHNLGKRRWEVWSLFHTHVPSFIKSDILLTMKKRGVGYWWVRHFGLEKFSDWPESYSQVNALILQLRKQVQGRALSKIIQLFCPGILTQNSSSTQ